MSRLARCEFFELRTIKLTAGDPWQSLGVKDAIGHLLGRKTCAARARQLIVIKGAALDDEGDDLIAIVERFTGNHRRLRNGRVRGEHGLDLGRENLGPRSPDPLADTAFEMEIALGIEEADIAGIVPAVGEEFGAGAEIFRALAEEDEIDRQRILPVTPTGSERPCSSTISTATPAAGRPTLSAFAIMSTGERSEIVPKPVVP